MPSFEHEKFVEVFSRDPRIVVQLAQATGQVRLPAYEALEIASEDAREVVPAAKRADALVLLRNGAGEAVFALVVEVQLGTDEEKRFSWPFYVSAARARYRCPTCLFVFAVDRAVAAWCAKGIDLGQPRSVFYPLVVGPEMVPVVTAAERAREAPFLALMSALAHGAGRQGAAVALAAWAGIEPMPEDVRGLWLQVLLTGLDDAAYEALKAVMNLEKFRTELPFYKEGRAEGRVEGRVEGEARTILVVLEARGLVVSDAQRAAIEAVRESARLDAMARKAAIATSVDELFAE